MHVDVNCQVEPLEVLRTTIDSMKSVKMHLWAIFNMALFFEQFGLFNLGD